MAERAGELAEVKRLLTDQLKSNLSNVRTIARPSATSPTCTAAARADKRSMRIHAQISVERLGQLVDDILNLSRTRLRSARRYGRTPTQRRSTQIVALHQPQAESAGINCFLAHLNCPGQRRHQPVAVSHQLVIMPLRCAGYASTAQPIRRHGAFHRGRRHRHPARSAPSFRALLSATIANRTISAPVSAWPSKDRRHPRRRLL